MVIATGFVGEYYGVQGTSWRDPPILQSPSETRMIGGRQYLLFYNGDRLRLVGWRTKRATYWVSNTLLQTLSAREMLGVARSLRPVQ
jgi:polyisoprenyl-teichoic acid--peptidoglycan teichoic acid transferase